MIYSLLRSASAIALRWYYSDVAVVGAERVPLDGPILVVMNHPNALVDVLVASKAVSRRLRFTAKATLFSNPVAATFFRSVGVLPLRRASDEAAKGQPVDPARNAEAFAAVADALAQSAAILIFPEGKSHDEPAMAPARTGAARMVIQAIESRHVRDIRVVPIGLIFERKERPRSRIVAVVGEVIDANGVVAADGERVPRLTDAIDSALRAVTLNYSSIEDADRDARLARTLQAIMRVDAPSVSEGPDFEARVEIARLLPSLRGALVRENDALSARATKLEADLLAFESQLKSVGVSLDDFSIDRGVKPGVGFVFREVAVMAVAGPIALWGWLNHVIPFRAALVAGKRIRHSAADPAMRTIVAGAAFVLMMYMLQGAAVTLFAGPWWGLAYVVSLPIAADINLRMRDRLHRSLRRARVYLSFRATPQVQNELVVRAELLRGEAESLGRAAGVLADA